MGEFGHLVDKEPRVHGVPAVRHPDDCLVPGAARRPSRLSRPATDPFDRQKRNTLAMTVRWTDEMITALRRLRAQGVTIYGCADAVGVSYGTAREKCSELGIGRRMNSGQRSGEKTMGQAALARRNRR